MRRKMRLYLCKIFQRRVYDLFSNKHSLLLCFAFFCMTFIAVLHIFEIFLIWSHKTESINSSKGQSCYDFPIDVVYTWVNGSDPKLIADLMKAKQELENTFSNQMQTPTDDCTHSETESNIESKDKDQEYIETPIVFMNSSLNNPNQLFDNITKLEKYDSGGTFIYFSSIAKAQEMTSKCVKSYNTWSYSLRKTHIILGQRLNTTTGALIGNRNHKNSEIIAQISSLILLDGIPANTSTHSQLLRYLSPFARKQVEIINIYDKKPIVLFAIKNPNLNVSKVIQSLRMSFERIQPIGQSVKIIHPIHLIVYGSDVESDGSSIKVQKSDSFEDLSDSRFADNQELRYSLRSIEKNANWVRNIYIVTNGQVPNWINLNNPRIQIITHEEIFQNKSHLPSFSSPAIETHLHRIPGLSKRFLYLNDDIFFGQPVYLEDFYTKSRGYKVYLSWPVPNCAEGCPMNWLRDGYCDPACNSSQCLWDGGDCEADKINGEKPNLLRHLSNPYTDSPLNLKYFDGYCSPNCVDSWLSDKFCDQVCNNIDCAYDLGDCGPKTFESIKGFDFRPKTNTYYFEYNSKAIYFNFSELYVQNTKNKNINNFEILSISYENNTFVRSSALNMNYKTLIFLFFNNDEKKDLNITLEGLKNNSEFVIRFQALVSNGSQLNTSYASIDEYIIEGEEGNGLTETYLFKNNTNNTFEKNTKIESNFKNQYQEYPKILPLNETQLNISLKCDFDINELPEQLKQKLNDFDLKFQKGLLTKKGLKNFRHRLIQLYVNRLCDYNNTLKTFDKTISAFEWEKQSTFAEIENSISSKEERDISGAQSGVIRRKLLDTYADSLRHVNQLYNRVFGIEMRKVPAHMSHFIDVDIMSRLQNSFTNHFDITSSHRIRSSDDMQFAFAYNYYLMSELKSVNISDVFNEFDVDGSGSWSESEIRTVIIHIYELPLKLQAFEEFYGNLIFCCNSMDYLCTEVSNKVNISEYYNRRLQTQRKQLIEIPKSLVINCENITNILYKVYENEKQNKFEILGEEDISFEMIRSNVTVVGQELDQLNKRLTKFMCFNDNIEHQNSEIDVIHVKQLLVNFYESIFPFKSQFELPLGQTNRFTNIREYKHWKNKQNVNFKYMSNILWIIVIVFTVILVFILRVNRRRILHQSLI